MTDTFQKTLTSVLTGVRQLDEMAGVLVGAAVEDALLCVARDYGHDYGLLLKRYKTPVVRRHASSSVSEKTLCRGTTKHNKKCGKRAQIQGYCMLHASQMAAEEAERRKLVAYRTRVRGASHTTTESALEHIIGKGLGVGPVSSKPYAAPVPAGVDAMLDLV